MNRLLNITAGISLLILITAIVANSTFAPNSLRIAFDQDGAAVAQAQTIQPGDGLLGTYFQNWQCSGTSKTRIDPRIDFDNDQAFGEGYHDPCIRWTGQIYTEGGSGNYTFYTRNDDGVTVRIDNQAVIDDANHHSATDNSGSINLEEKRRYDVDIEFFDGGGPAIIKLEWSGPGVSKQIIPQRVLYSKRVQCSDSSDNDNDGDRDYPDDPGCESAHDDDETNPACMDGLDNDGDGKTDHPADPGCDSASDTEEYNDPLPLCSDGIDNDLDGLIDFPSDKGCESATDGDETDPPEPVCSDGLDNDGDGKTDFPNDIGCTSLLDNSEGNPACSDGIDNDADNEIDFPDDRGCESPLDDDETNLPVDRNIQLGTGSGGTIDPNKYPISVLADEQNNYHVRVRQGDSFEFVPMSATPLPPTEGAALQNGALYYFLLEGQDSAGLKHVAIKPGRYWNRATLTNPDHSNQPLIDFFSVGGSIDRCVAALQTFPSVHSFISDPTLFQTFLDMLMLCEQTTPGAVTP